MSTYLGAAFARVREAKPFQVGLHNCPPADAGQQAQCPCGHKCPCHSFTKLRRIYQKDNVRNWNGTIVKRINYTDDRYGRQRGAHREATFYLERLESVSAHKVFPTILAVDVCKEQSYFFVRIFSPPLHIYDFLHDIFAYSCPRM